jgi:hypothetical protein
MKSIPTIARKTKSGFGIPVLGLSLLTRPTGPNCRKILKASRRARKTVLLWKQEFICQRRLTETALPGVAPNRSFRAATTSLQKARVLRALRLHHLGYPKLLIANKRIPRFPFCAPFAQRGVSRVRR